MSQGQILITNSGVPYNQDFNTLANSGSANAWTNNETLAGWYVTAGSSFLTYYPTNDGSNSASNVYSFGSTGSSDRAFGAIAIGSTTTARFGLRMKNNTGKQITSFQIFYRGEQWREGTATSTGNATNLNFSYRVGTTLTDPSEDGSPTWWTTVSALTFTAPNMSGNAGALNGNAPGNFTDKSATVNVTVNNGQEIMFRWVKTYATGSHGLAFDDVVIIPVTNEPSVICSQTSLSFDNTEVGSSKTLTFSAERANLTGTPTLTMQSSASSVFSVTPASLPQSNGTTTVSVTFTPAADITYNDILIISGGGLEEPVQVVLTGKGITENPPPPVPTYTVIIQSPTNGTINVMNGTIPITTGAVLDSGTVLTLIANPNAGYTFDKWWDNNTNATRTYLLNNNITISALFDEITGPQIFTHTVGYSTGDQNSTDSWSTIPIDGSYMGAKDPYTPSFIRPVHHTQTVYTANKLQPLLGSRIAKISYRLSNIWYVPESFNWQATGTIKLVPTTATNVRYGFVDISTTTPVSVCQGEFKYQNRVMEFVFETPLVYQGGSLLVDIEKTPGTGVDQESSFMGGATCYADDPYNQGWKDNPDNFVSRVHVSISPTETYLVPMHRFPEITFTYVPYEYHVITATATTGGTITPTGGVMVEVGTNQTFTFVPDAGHQISQVLINGVNNPTAVATGEYTFTNVTTEHTIQVAFSLKSYIITPSVISGDGTIYPDQAVVINHGSNQKFDFTPNTGNKIAQVLIDGVNNAAAVANGYHTFENVAANHTVVVSFEVKTLTIEASVIAGNGTITPNGTATVNYGEDKIYSIAADNNYRILKLLINGEEWTDAVGERYYIYTFENITENHTIGVIFYIPGTTYTVTINHPAHGTIDVEDVTNGNVIQSGASILPGTELEISVFVDENYVFNSILINNIVYSQTNPTVYIAGNENIVISANVLLTMNEPNFSNITVYAQQNRVYIINENNVELKSIQIIDFLGRTIYEGSTKNSTVIRVEAATGIYVVRLISGDAQVNTTKVYLTK
jgi:hypothetical protein